MEPTGWNTRLPSRQEMRNKVSYSLFPACSITQENTFKYEKYKTHQVYKYDLIKNLTSEILMEITPCNIHGNRLNTQPFYHITALCYCTGKLLCFLTVVSVNPPTDTERPKST